jgi:hypothetical protein
MKLINFPDKTKEEEPIEVNEEVVRMIEQILEMAKEGWVDGAAIAVTYRNGDTGNCFNSVHPTLILGEMRALERDLLDIMIDGRCHKAGDEY